MDSNETLLCDESQIAAMIQDLADQIAAGRTPNAPLVMVGIKTRGEPIAHRVAEILRKTTRDTIHVGAVDITLYRDDLGKGTHWPVLKGTEIPFSVDGAEVILVDDVLFTGRTVRAAMNCVCDLGRPAAVRLAVLVDRGGHELPIRADYSAKTVKLGPEQRVRVRLLPNDKFDRIVTYSSSRP